MTQNRRKETTFKVEQAIAYEFGYFLEATKYLVIVNGDSELINNQLERTKVKIQRVNQKELDYYKVLKDHTEFKINGKIYSINALLPKQASLSIQMTLILLDYLKIKPDYSFSKFSLPPGRCSLFKGIKNTTIIDSSYNATPDGVKTILELFDLYPSNKNKKWVVLGDMIELGLEEQEEHEKLADMIASMKLEKIILIGPRLSKYTYPKLQPQTHSQNVNNRTMEQSNNGTIETFLMPKDALDYLRQNLQGGETILFKGARFLEGIIEHLLVNQKDVGKLCRRELIWQERRERWGL